MRRIDSAIARSCIAICVLTGACARADEGFWLYAAAPVEQIKARYGYEPAAAWLDHLMKASAALRVGPNLDASGAFVSGDGLFLTTFHTARQFVERLDPERTQYARAGFLARSLHEEIKLPGAVVRSVRATTKATSDLDAYRYQEYSDVRLVFCPEEARAIVRDLVAGENVRYPESFHLDVCLFRAYERGRPARVREFLRWSRVPVRDGELVFASGNPIRSNRRQTLAEFRFERDVSLPVAVEAARKLQLALQDWSDGAVDRSAADTAVRSAARERRSSERKLALMQDPGFVGRKAAQQEGLREQFVEVGHRAALQALDQISQEYRDAAIDFPRYYLLELAAGFDSELFAFARLLWRARAERSKPEGERLPAFVGASNERVTEWLSAEHALDQGAQRARLGAWLELLAEKLGYEDAVVQRALAGKSPGARAGELVANTRVGAVAYRRALLGAATLAAVDDPMIELVGSIDAEARALWTAKEVRDEAIAGAQAAVARGWAELPGEAFYPDASGALRLSYGVVKGSLGEDGRDVPPWSTYGDLYRRSGKVLTPDPAIALNFATTVDAIGGSSGSPVVNTAGELVGVIRGVSPSASTSVLTYDGERMRSICVSAAAILEELRRTYHANELVDELLTGLASKEFTPRRPTGDARPID